MAAEKINLHIIEPVLKDSINIFDGLITTGFFVGFD